MNENSETGFKITKWTFHSVQLTEKKDFRFVCPSLVILGDPGAVSRVDKMFVVKVYCNIEILQ